MDKKKSRSSRQYSRSYYNYGSEAYKYYPNSEYGRRTRTSKNKRQEKPKAEKRRKTTKKPRIHYEFVRLKTGDFRICFSIAVLFAFIIIFVCLYAINNKKENEFNEYTQELAKLQESNEVLKTEVSKNVNLAEIEKIAKTKLHMQKAGTHQIVYIDIPKQNYTVQYDRSSSEQQDDDGGFSLKSIWNNLFGD